MLHQVKLFRSANGIFIFNWLGQYLIAFHNFLMLGRHLLINCQLLMLKYFFIQIFVISYQFVNKPTIKKRCGLIKAQQKPKPHKSQSLFRGVISGSAQSKYGSTKIIKHNTFNISFSLAFCFSFSFLFDSFSFSYLCRSQRYTRSTYLLLNLYYYTLVEVVHILIFSIWQELIHVLSSENCPSAKN